MLSAAKCYHILKVPFTKSHLIKIIIYCYHSVNVITFSLAQSGHIKPLLLYNYEVYGVSHRTLHLTFSALAIVISPFIFLSTRQMMVGRTRGH